MSGKLTGKVVLITGSSPNIGGSIAEGMADEGAAIVCVDVMPENAYQCAEYLKGRGADALGVVCDVTDETQVKSTLEQAQQKFGFVDVLVNNAVMFKQKGVLDMTLEEWERQTGIILSGSFLFTKYVASALIDQKRRGSIINIISTAGHQGQPGNVGYCTGKSGLLNFTRSVAMELAEYGIRVNSLTPTATALEEGFDRAAKWGRPKVDSVKFESVMNGFRKSIPMQQLPRPADYAKTAVFLASEDAAMLTGTDIKVDAGALARYWAWDPAVA